MGKRLADADGRRFFDEFASVRVSRLRATGVVDPSKRYALIPVGECTKLLNVAHTHFPCGGGFSYFVCPRCAKLAQTLYLIDDAPRCRRCCHALNIVDRSAYGFGRTERLRARDQYLDALIRKLETTEPLMLKPAPPNWVGRCRRVQRGNRLTMRMRRNMIALRLNQLASQQAKDNGGLNITRVFTPRATTAQVLDIKPIWRARTTQTALDAAQETILGALQSSDPKTRLNAAKLMLKNAKQDRWDLHKRRLHWRRAPDFPDHKPSGSVRGTLTGILWGAK